MRLPRLIGEHPVAVLVATLLISLVALWPASRLGLETRLEALLPQGSPEAEGYRAFLEHFGGLEKVMVLLQLEPAAQGSDQALEQQQDQLLEAAAALAEELRESPLVDSARSGITSEDEAFLTRWVVPRAPLLLGEGWQQELEPRLDEAAIKERARQIRSWLVTPTGSVRAPLLRSDPLGLAEDLLGDADVASGAPIDPLTLGFLAPAGDTALVIVTPVASELDPEAGRALQQALDAAFARVTSGLQTPIHMHALGGPLYAAQDEAVIRADLQRTLTSSAVGCAVVLVLAFEGVLAPVAVLIAVAVGLLWTAALVAAGMGSISAASLGFAAVLVGLGIDYGIHGCARFRQSLATLGDPRQALAETVREAGPAIVTSALTTAGAFAVLRLAHFRPLAELGTVVASGILAILVASATLGAAAMVLLGNHMGRPGRVWRLLGAVSGHAVGLATRRPRAVLIGAGLLTFGSLWGLTGLRLDADLRSLRPADHPALEAEALLADRFGMGLGTTTVVIGAADLPTALGQARRVGDLLGHELGPEARITSPATWLVGPEPLDQRLAELSALPLKTVADQLEQALEANGLAPAAFATGLTALRRLAAGADPGPPPREHWPSWLTDQVRVDASGAWVAISIRTPLGIWPDGPPAATLATIEQAAPDAAVASATGLGAAIRGLAHRDLERLGAVGLLAVALVVLLSFRGRPGRSLLATLPVLLGTCWTLGLWGALGRPLDIMSLAVLPILLGIGVDDGLHAVHGAGRRIAAGLPGSVDAAGRAMVLTTLTTCVGFGSLTLSRVPGLQHGGLLVALGVLACLAATLLLLPAIACIAGATADSSHGTEDRP